MELEGGGNGGEVLDGDHLLLHHCLKLPNGVIHDGGKLKAQEQLKLSSSGPGPGLTLGLSPPTTHPDNFSYAQIDFKPFLYDF